MSVIEFLKVQNAIPQFKAALLRRDAVTVGRCVDILRFRGLNYNQIFSVAQNLDPTLDLPEWESLMYEADEVES